MSLYRTAPRLSITDLTLNDSLKPATRETEYLEARGFRGNRGYRVKREPAPWGAGILFETISDQQFVTAANEIAERKTSEDYKDGFEYAGDRSWQMMFHLAHYTKLHPRHGSLTGEEACQLVEPLGLMEEDLYEFAQKWDSIMEEPTTLLVEFAVLLTNINAPIVSAERPLYARFLSILAWLQALRGPAPIYLSFRSAQPILGIKYKSISPLFHFAERHGFLTKVSDHTRTEAARYFFNFELLQTLG